MMPPRITATILVALLVAGCGLAANTQIGDSIGEAKRAFRSIAVIAMSGSKAERQAFDDVLVARLAAAGVKGIVGDRYIEDAAVANGVAPMQAIRAAGADGVLYVWLHQVGDKAGVPSPQSWGATGAAAYWYSRETTPQSRFEARLYNVDTQGLVWSGATRTFYPKTLAVDAPPVANAIVDELVKRGFIEK